MRWTKTFIPTLREVPAEAETVSHQLMLRAGLMRKLASGLYTYLPLGWRFIRKVERIIREEMDRAGALEVAMPMLHPLELWEQSGRAKTMGPEMMRLNDRNERGFVLGPTHEEIITALAAGEIRSYKQLPVNFYQIANKFRDEIRPRFGVMRAREFIMKDAYSFDTDDTGVAKSYQLMFDAYKLIFDHCGLTTVAVEADTGAMGGSFSHEFMVPADIGEDRMAVCSTCGYAANLEKAESALPENEWVQDLVQKAYQAVDTPNMRTIEEVSSFLKIQPKQLVKTLIYQADAHVVAALIRGDHQINESKLKKAVGCETLSLATPQVIESVTKAPVGFAGPVGLNTIPLIADPAVIAMPYLVTGGNKADIHFIYVKPNRDFTPTKTADIRTVVDGERCIKCNGTLKVSFGIEVGHCFKLGTKYSESFNAKYLDADGKENPLIMGCYGIGVTRTAAAVIEQNHDKDGIIFPWSVAPYQIYLMTVNTSNPELVQTAESIYTHLVNAGFEVLYDDRNERPGVKFKDADLLGLPIRVIISERNLKQGLVEITRRKTKQSQLVNYNLLDNDYSDLFKTITQIQTL
ncbi:MAG: proline--tRNA ligase [bacterium]|nr:proline--tRNA ligase [bacterium]